MLRRGDAGVNFGPGAGGGGGRRRWRPLALIAATLAGLGMGAGTGMGAELVWMGAGMEPAAGAARDSSLDSGSTSKPVTIVGRGTVAEAGARADAGERHDAAMTFVATSQDLDAGSGAGPGLDLEPPVAPPELPARSGALDLAETLDREARELLVESQRMQAEARSGLAARGRLRSVAAFLLQTGAARPWDESAPVVAGIRLAGILRRADGLIEAALDVRSMRTGQPLAPDEARAAVAAVDGIARIDLDRVRDACGAKGPLATIRLADALAETLAPLVTLSRIVEGIPLPDPWPVVGGSTAPAGARPASEVDVDVTEMRRAAAAISPASGRDAAAAAVERVFAPAAGAHVEVDRRLVSDALAMLAWLDGIRRAGPPLPFPAAALDAATERTVLALGDLAASAADARDAARERLGALADVLQASKALLELRDGFEWNDRGRRALSDAAAALLSGELAGDVRARAAAAARIRASIEALGRLAVGRVEGGTAGGPARAPRDLKDVARDLERDAGAARRALPEAFMALAADPGRLGDPGVQSAIERIVAIDGDRRRIERLQAAIDAIGGIRPKAGRAFVGVARRLARDLADPLRRPAAQAAFANLDLQLAQAIPLPYEDELKRRTDRALERTGGEASRLVERAAEARIAWAESVGAGDLSGAAARRLDWIARLFACLRDLDLVDASISREGGDRLATWGGWASRRAALAPATQDLVARAALASRALLEARDADGERAFERDVVALERAIPLVQLVARLERELAPGLRAPPESTAALLAPLVRAPSPDAALREAWPSLRAIDRALFEMEYARRSGNRALLDALSAYVASVARETTIAAFGPRPSITATPSVDTSGEEPRDRTRRGT